MKEATYIVQTESSTKGIWIDTIYVYQEEHLAEESLASFRKTVLEINSPSIFRVMKQTREVL